MAGAHGLSHGVPVAAGAIGRWARPPQRKASDRSTTYERWVRQSAGGPADQEFVVEHPDGKDIWFDGVRYEPDRGWVLLEAKGHYAQFIDRDRDDWHPWYRYSRRSGLPKLLAQARRQVEAARGVPVEWLCAELIVAELLSDEFRVSPSLSGRVTARFRMMSGRAP
jgi:hypothetical protein